MTEKEKDEAEEVDRDDDTSGAKVEGREEAPAKGDGDDDNASAARVAEALGVADGEEPAEGEGAEADGEAKAEEAPQNRAARRREEAIERRRKRKGAPAGEELPKDKNKRAKELLTRRRESAAEPRPAQLEAGEMVDDALARGWASTTKWLRTNLPTIQWVIAAGVVGVAGFVGYSYFTQRKLGGASALLASGAAAEAAYVLAEDKRPEEDKELDPTMVFKTADERADKALAAYRDVAQKHAGSGAAILARLGEGGVLLDKRDWDKAIEAFDAVLKTPLAAADPDVKGRSIEGIALAKEGKGDAEGAMADFKRLETIDAKGYKELSQYHQGRLLLAKNTEEDRAKAKDLLKAAYDKIKEPSLDKKPMPYLEKSLEQALRNIDPALVPDKESINSVRGNQMSPEEIQARIRKMQEEMNKKGGGESHGDEH